MGITDRKADKDALHDDVIIHNVHAQPFQQDFMEIFIKTYYYVVYFKKDVHFKTFLTKNINQCALQAKLCQSQ